MYAIPTSSTPAPKDATSPFLASKPGKLISTITQDIGPRGSYGTHTMRNGVTTPGKWRQDTSQDAKNSNVLSEVSIPARVLSLCSACTFLCVEELEKRYRRAKGVTERNHYQIIWLMAQGKRSHKVAEVTGYHVERVRQIVRDYNKGGPEQVGDQRPGRSGRKRLLTAEQEAASRVEVEQAFAYEEPYTRVQVAQRMSEMLGRPVHPARGWALLQRWQLQLKQPRRQHVKRDVAEGEAFKKT